jgi:hypothetical protein
MRWIQLLIEHPESGTILVVSTVCLIVYLTALFVNVRHMQKAMVTKKDLSIALGAFKDDLNGTFMTRRECKLITHLEE